MRRVSIVTANPDPASIDPFIVTGDPDRVGVGTFPSGIILVIRRRTPDMDAERLSGCPVGAYKHGRASQTSQHDCSKRCYFHGKYLDLFQCAALQFFQETKRTLDASVSGLR